LFHAKERNNKLKGMRRGEKKFDLVQLPKKIGRGNEEVL